MLLQSWGLAQHQTMANGPTWLWHQLQYIPFNRGLSYHLKVFHESFCAMQIWGMYVSTTSKSSNMGMSSSSRQVRVSCEAPLGGRYHRSYLALSLLLVVTCKTCVWACMSIVPHMHRVDASSLEVSITILAFADVSNHPLYCLSPSACARSSGDFWCTHLTPSSTSFVHHMTLLVQACSANDDAASYEACKRLEDLGTGGSSSMTPPDRHSRFRTPSRPYQSPSVKEPLASRSAILCRSRSIAMHEANHPTRRDHNGIHGLS